MEESCLDVRGGKSNKSKSNKKTTSSKTFKIINYDSKTTKTWNICKYCCYYVGSCEIYLDTNVEDSIERKNIDTISGDKNTAATNGNKNTTTTREQIVKEYIKDYIDKSM